LAVFEHGPDARVDLRLEASDLCGQVDEGDLAHFGPPDDSTNDFANLLIENGGA
jgi:hypothetical protein